MAGEATRLLLNFKHVLGTDFDPYHAVKLWNDGQKT